MRTALFALYLVIAAVRADAWSEWSRKYNIPEGKPFAAERDYIIRIFDFYSQLQHNFQQEHYSERSRDLIEDYTSAILLPACASCAKLLRQGHDTELMLAFFRLLQFTQDDASESFGAYLAEIFLANPDLVESAYRRLTPKQQHIGYAELSWGFGNRMYGRKHSDATKRLEERLARMKPKSK